MVGISSIHPRRFISSNTSKPSASGITTSSSSAAILPSCAASVAMASGWSPDGSKGETTLNGVFASRTSGNFPAISIPSILER